MCGNRIVVATVAIAFAGGAMGCLTLAAAQAVDRSPTAQNAGTPKPPSGAGAAEQNRSGGQFSPGGVPTKNQATTQPSVPPNGIGAVKNKSLGGDLGPGGTPTTGQAATTPSRPGRRGEAPSDNRTRK